MSTSEVQTLSSAVSNADSADSSKATTKKKAMIAGLIIIIIVLLFVYRGLMISVITSIIDNIKKGVMAGTPATGGGMRTTGSIRSL